MNVFVVLEGDLVTLRYDAEDDDELHSWEECVRLDSIGAVSTRLAYFSRSADADDIEVTGDYPESEQLPARAEGAERPWLQWAVPLPS